MGKRRVTRGSIGKAKEGGAENKEKPAGKRREREEPNQSTEKSLLQPAAS